MCHKNNFTCGPCVFKVHIIIKILNNTLSKKTLNEIMMLLIYNDYKMRVYLKCILLRTYCSYMRYINLMRMPSHDESLESAIVMTFNQYTLHISFASIF